MSGPTTASFTLASDIASAAPLWQVARALHEAREMHREYQAVLAELQQQEGEIAQTRKTQQAARLARQTRLRQQVEGETARVERLRALAAPMVANQAGLAALLESTLPPPPEGDDEDAWGRHLRALQAYAEQLRAQLALAGKAFASAFENIPGLGSQDLPSLADLLHAYALQRSRDARLSPELTERFQATASRILARLHLDPGEVMPIELEQLASRIVLAPDIDRAEALASELRLAVQRAETARTTRERDAAEARELLEALDAALQRPEHAPLLRALNLAVIGAAPLTPAARDMARALQSDLQAALETRNQQAAASILEASLKDLGYEVDAIAETLFIDGGVVHFQRHGWENYFVRLRLNAAEKTVNFNVVRARDGEESAERKRLDTLAEDRWCSEFPKLMETLKARGIALDVTRLLGAGEVPVQAVDPATLPARQEETGRRPEAALRQHQP